VKNFGPINSQHSKEHAQHIEQYIYELKKFCHEEAHTVSDAKDKALFETTADVLEGLKKAYSDFQSENLGGWVNDINRLTPQ
jgi:hypothetical protein